MAVASFLSSLKIERIKGRVYRTRDEARADVSDDIERIYSTVRRYATNSYLSTVEFEKTVGLA